MHLQQMPTGGTNESPPPLHSKDAPVSPSLPFGQPLSLRSIGGPTYLTAQTLVQHVAFTLSDKIFSYSPPGFDLDAAARHWAARRERNGFGHETGVQPLELRRGAGALALGYIFSADFDLSKRHVPQAVLATTAALLQMRSALDELALLYGVANPLVAHVAAVDYSAAKGGAQLVTDYAAAMGVAEDAGLGLVASVSAFEVQHMALFATLLASVVPTVHIYDGVALGRETNRVVDVLDQSGIYRNYKTILDGVASVEKRHSDNEGRTIRLLEKFNDEFGTEYKLFEYRGHAEPDTVLVVFGSTEASLTAQVADRMADEGERVGVVNVRVYRPFVEEAFIEAVPKTALTIAVLGQVINEAAVYDADEHSRLYSDVFAAVSFSTHFLKTPAVIDAKYPREQTWTPGKVHDVFLESIGKRSDAEGAAPLGSLLESSLKQYSFWDADSSPAAGAPNFIAQLLSGDSATNVSLRTGYDNLVQGGVVRTDVRSSSRSIDAAYSVTEADLAFVGEEKLLKEFSIVDTLNSSSTLVVKLFGLKEGDLEKRIPAQIRKGLWEKNVKLYVLDLTASEKSTENNSVQSYITQLALLSLIKSELLHKARQALSSNSDTMVTEIDVSAELEKVLQLVEVPESWASTEEEAEPIRLPLDIKTNSFARADQSEPDSPSLLKTWEAAAKGLVFKEAYSTKSALRPDLGFKTAVVHVKEHRRLTPLTYDRNIFHIEFDLGDSGLKYDLGEALGIHATNDTSEVDEFIKWYGLDPSAIVEVPSREDPDVLEARTVFQALQQNIDIFGRPPKRFYEALAAFASDEKEQRALLSLSTPEGAIEFKRRAEVDTITFADVLLEYPSAHPGMHDIARIVSPMKRREYSIASSQRATPTSVSLLIVTVGWVDPRGRDRFGQATRYLNALPIGAAVTVSVKPSVMKLPPSPSAPVIMAGLGTGLAPFRAFVQERAHQRFVEGKDDVGPMLLYMGSRRQREEYLYGEEWEAYRDAGVITLLGRAFSRDQPHKIYIQDRMRETLGEIREAYLRKEGSFYLCGPTWPVPDVTGVLEEAIVREETGKGTKRVDSRREIERLKDEGRYVLEVY